MVREIYQAANELEKSGLNRLASLASDFPVVCVGGSAGGLDAYIRLLQNLPTDLGVAIVIVNHITKMPTLLHEVLPSYTSMPVELITESLLIKPNCVFIIPANRDLHVADGQFRLRPISKHTARPVDRLRRSVLLPAWLPSYRPGLVASIDLAASVCHSKCIASGITQQNFQVSFVSKFDNAV